MDNSNERRQNNGAERPTAGPSEHSSAPKAQKVFRSVLLMGVPVRPNKEGVGQGLAHFASKVAFLGPMCLVHHHDDVLAVVQHSMSEKSY